MIRKIEPSMLKVPEDILDQWQSIVDVMAELAEIPAGLIMRIDKQDIEVFLASQVNGNPYYPGDREHLVGSGLYCETVIKTKQPLLVADALADPKWKNNPDVKLNMISYLGFPIFLPDNTPFGTICVLDIKANSYSPTIRKLIERFRDLIQTNLELLYMNEVLGDKNRRLSEYLDELQSFRGTVLICVSCKRIKDSKGNWNSVEKYLINHPEADFSHGYCPECYKKAKDEIEQS